MVATRVVCRSKYLYDIDSVNFALGLKRFDPGSHQPHPPGYFLYICLGRMVNAFVGDANAAFIAISIAASCGALIMIYLLSDDWFGRKAAVFSGLIFLFSPLVWFHGTVALTYAVEAFFSSLTGYLCWRLICGSTNLVVPIAITIGVAAGFRPSFLLFLSPLFLFALRGMPRKRILTGLFMLAVTVFAWGLPMISQSGGLVAYSQALLSLWRSVPGKQTVFNSSIGNTLARLFSIAGIYLLCFGSAALLTLRLSHVGPGIDPRKKSFTWVWVSPGLLFFSLIFLKFVNSGYLLVVSPPAFAWLGLCAARAYGNLRFQYRTKLFLVTAFALANTFIYLFAPIYCSFASVRRFETELGGLLISLPEVATPEDTLIIGFDSHFLGYRHAGYYLPGYSVVQYPEVRLIAGVRIFMMEHRDTRVADRIALRNYKKFLFFPLPSDDAGYSDYMSQLRSRFRKGALGLVKAGGREFTTGAIGDLPHLFPLIDTGLSTAEHTSGVPVDPKLRTNAARP